MRTRSLLVALGTAATIAVGAAPAQAAPVVLNQGHADVIGVAYEDGQLHVHVHDETVEPGVEREPCDVIIEVKSSAQLAVPDDPAYAFLGAPGAPVWILPQVEDPNLLFAGIGTEEIEPGALVGDSVRIKLAGVYGPGHFSLFTTDEVGAPTVLLNSRNGLPDSFTVAAGTHMHANWAFTKSGSYYLVFVVTARDANTNKVVSSGPVVYRFNVLGASS
ncbi:choice-of-anchor M domain-containing protein [Allorhizocola rhizosphaerae]|uniref:choice-of-anchor M domain-containing protein n=1 Tax=Allorhizocola rhizosphaerae TaxID=1872709 RepID=UPI0013C349F5|nr:choice-of-anchor M domain-containing protein [Allorhizocola rhizosphaerae]